jgi:hypothetical protein
VRLSADGDARREHAQQKRGAGEVHPAPQPQEKDRPSQETSPGGPDVAV